MKYEKLLNHITDINNSNGMGKILILLKILLILEININQYLNIL